MDVEYRLVWNTCAQSILIEWSIDTLTYSTIMTSNDLTRRSWSLLISNVKSNSIISISTSYLSDSACRTIKCEYLRYFMQCAIYVNGTLPITQCAQHGFEPYMHRNDGKPCTVSCLI